MEPLPAQTQVTNYAGASPESALAKPSCLIVVDVQKGFINPETEHIPSLVEVAQARYMHVVATRFYNPPPESLYRKIIHWHRFSPGSEDVDFAFSVRPDALVIDKPRYSCVDEFLLATLRRWNVTQADVCGIDTDICVTKTAVDLFEAGIVPRVLSRLSASCRDSELHDAALQILRRYIGAAQEI